MSNATDALNRITADDHSVKVFTGDKGTSQFSLYEGSGEVAIKGILMGHWEVIASLKRTRKDFEGASGKSPRDALLTEDGTWGMSIFPNMLGDFTLAPVVTEESLGEAFESLGFSKYVIHDSEVNRLG